MQTNICAWSGIRTDKPNFQAGEDSSFLRPRCHCDRRGSLNGMSIDAENLSVGRYPAPEPLCLPYISHDLTWDWTRAVVVESRRIVARRKDFRETIISLCIISGNCLQREELYVSIRLCDHFSCGEVTAVRSGWRPRRSQRQTGHIRNEKSPALVQNSTLLNIEILRRCRPSIVTSSCLTGGYKRLRGRY
jgi:hypothetical protein